MQRVGSDGVWRSRGSSEGVEGTAKESRERRRSRGSSEGVEGTEKELERWRSRGSSEGAGWRSRGNREGVGKVKEAREQWRSRGNGKGVDGKAKEARERRRQRSRGKDEGVEGAVEESRWHSSVLVTVETLRPRGVPLTKTTTTDDCKRNLKQWWRHLDILSESVRLVLNRRFVFGRLIKKTLDSEPDVQNMPTRFLVLGYPF